MLALVLLFGASVFYMYAFFTALTAWSTPERNFVPSFVSTCIGNGITLSALYAIGVF